MHGPRAVAVVMAMLLSACASGVGGTPATSGAPLNLDGTSWVVTAIKDAPTLSGKEPTIVFADGSLGGNATCNQYTASYTHAGSALTIGQVAQTAMLCADAALNTQENAFGRALGEVRQVRATPGGAELVTAAGEAVLTLAPAPMPTPKPLVGTTWTLSGIVSGETATSPLEGTIVTMTLTDDGLAGKACNTFRGSVTRTDSTLTIGPLMSTKMACPTEQEGKQESTVLAILGAVSGYTVEGDLLTLSAPDGKGLVFTA